MPIATLAALQQERPIRGSTPFDRSKPYVQPPVTRGIIRCGAEGGRFEQQGCLGHNCHRCRNGHMRDGIQAVLVCANRGRTAVRGHSRNCDLPTGRVHRLHDEGLDNDKTTRKLTGGS